MAPDDFVMTLDSEEESPSDAITLSKHPNSKEAEEALLDPAFTFDMSGDPYTDLIQGGTDFADLVKSGSKPVCSFRASSGSLNIVRLGSNIRR
jgi:ATP-dependent RNA helicase DDX27